MSDQKPLLRLVVSRVIHTPYLDNGQTKWQHDQCLAYDPPNQEHPFSEFGEQIASQIHGAERCSYHNPQITWVTQFQLTQSQKADLKQLIEKCAGRETSLFNRVAKELLSQLAESGYKLKPVDMPMRPYKASEIHNRHKPTPDDIRLYPDKDDFPGWLGLEVRGSTLKIWTRVEKDPTANPPQVQAGKAEPARPPTDQSFGGTFGKVTISLRHNVFRTICCYKLPGTNHTRPQSKTRTVQILCLSRHT